ncbi:hypothetical protein L3Y34_007329 [Caenorhabditis briggsae]|uniref:G-protein coupled receptors family 1 profile domain-containing protein n=1 Tax=Caenorhabditis briggsae TaxID=6238 RepID=A0AAE9A688_CAEBR|nr:hypothetical protein L3Y34_007329 [Caenorhabditis briggsae]
MRNSSTNIILIGMAMCDLIYMIIIWRNDLVLMNMMKECSIPRTLNQLRLDWFLTALHNMLRRCSAWLGMLMAVVRYLVITNITIRNNRFSTPEYGLKVVIAALIISSIFTFFFFADEQIKQIGTWTPDPKCAGLSGEHLVFAQKVNQYSDDRKSIQTRTGLIVEGIFSKMVPCFTLPIITGLLICGMKRSFAKNSSTVETSNKNIRVSRANRTTILTILIAGSFLLSEFPLGIVDLYKGIWPDDQSWFRDFCLNLEFICDAIFSVNASVHCLIIFIMSSQYRRTVWNLFGILKFWKSRNTSQIAAASSSY